MKKTLITLSFLFVGFSSFAMDPSLRELTVADQTYKVVVREGTYLSLSSSISRTPWWNGVTDNPRSIDPLVILREYLNSNNYFPNAAAIFPANVLRSPFSVGETNGSYFVNWANPNYTQNLAGFGGGFIANFTDPALDGSTEFYWLLILEEGPTLADTRFTLVPHSLALRNAFNLQSAKISQGLNYDCTVFDANNICVSFAGTRSNSSNGFDNTTGALIIAHRPTANIRVGAYADQTMGTTDSMGLKVKRGSPGYGVFGVWSQRTDGLGTQVRVAANSGKVDIETTRLAIETAEAGFGQSNIKSNGVQLEVSQGYALNNQWTTRPYVGYRQMTNKRGAYTEQTSDLVTSPLAYTGLKQTTESILAGIRFVGKLTPQTSLNLSAGIERDVKSMVDNYQAINADIGDIDAINMTQNIKKTRPVASVGLVHSLDKTQTVGLFVTHRKEALQSSSTTSGMLQYSVGF